MNQSAGHHPGSSDAIAYQLAGAVPGAPIARFIGSLRGHRPWRLPTILSGRQRHSIARAWLAALCPSFEGEQRLGGIW